jgi:hypothetical protein
MNGANTIEKEKLQLVSIICLTYLTAFIAPAQAAAGDLILDTEILLPYTVPYDEINSTILKEG